MKKEVVTRKPKTEVGVPEWYNMHGSKINIIDFDTPTLTLIIAGGAASLRISYIFAKRWAVRWEIIQSVDQKIKGSVYFSPSELEAAFGLSGDSGDFGDWIIERYGADSAEQGKYIRWDRFLNIPCPGTGHDGDPNISIYVDDVLRDAVQDLLSVQSQLGC